MAFTMNGHVEGQWNSTLLQHCV